MAAAPICYSFHAHEFARNVDSLKFKSNVLVQVNSVEEFELAKECGLKTLAAVGLKVEADYHLMLPNTAAAASNSVFYFDSLQQQQQIRKLLDEQCVVLCRLNGTSPPSFVDSCTFFAQFSNNKQLILANSTLNMAGAFQYLENYMPPLPYVISKQLQVKKRRIAILEATTGGMVASALLAVPGASAFFISGAIVYTARGAKRILPASVLQASSMMERERNYSNMENYFASKYEYCENVAKLMRVEMKADLMLVESGTVGPDFRVPGVDKAFTVVGVAGPNGFYVARHIIANSRDREQNMRTFCEFALETLHQALAQEQALVDEKRSGL